MFNGNEKTVLIKHYQQQRKNCYFSKTPLSLFSQNYLRLEVKKKQPSVHLLTHSRAQGFFSNSTIPSPVDRPRASTPTTHRSISPKTENDLCNNSLETQGPNLIKSSNSNYSIVFKAFERNIHEQRYLTIYLKSRRYQQLGESIQDFFSFKELDLLPQ